MATCSSDRLVKIWQPSLNWSLLLTFASHDSEVYALDFLSADNVVSGDQNGRILIWSARTGQTLSEINASSSVDSLKVLSDGVHLAAGVGMNINIFNVKTSSLVSTLQGHTSLINDLVFQDKDFLASSSDDRTIRVWNLTTNACLYVLQGHTNQVYGLTLVSLNLIASGSLDTTVKLWDLSSGRSVRTLTGHGSSIWYSVDMLDFGQTLVSGSYYDRTLKLWNVNTGQQLITVNTGVNINSVSVVRPITMTSKKKLDRVFIFRYHRSKF